MTRSFVIAELPKTKLNKYVCSAMITVDWFFIKIISAVKERLSEEQKLFYKTVMIWSEKKTPV